MIDRDAVNGTMRDEIIRVSGGSMEEGRGVGVMVVVVEKEVGVMVGRWT